jgi:hypothetical protein
MMYIEQIVEAAIVRAGCAGTPPASALEGLEIFLEDVRATPKVADKTKHLLGDYLAVTLSNRLRVEDYLRQHPEVVETDVKAPTIIFGLPRTGTTFLVNLLACDPGRRSLMNWEAMDSAPPPTREGMLTDPRCMQKLELQKAFLREHPEARYIHWEFAYEPTECDILHAHDFRSFRIARCFPAPKYNEWLRSCDMAPAYDFHKRTLQMLQSKAGGVWNLKCPMHGLYLDFVLAAYPDARLIWTHRNPVESLASTCSSIRNIHELLGLKTDPKAIGYEVAYWLHELVARAGSIVSKLSSAQVYHLPYTHLVRDPLGEVKRLYQWLGDPLTQDIEKSMRAHATESSQFAGRHHYSIDEFGLTKRQVIETFADYVMQDRHTPN